MGGLLSSKRVTLWAAVAVLIVAGVLPLCVMLATSFSNIQNYTETLGRARTWGLFRNSLLLATLTTVVAGLAGVTLGVLLAKTDLPCGTRSPSCSLSRCCFLPTFSPWAGLKFWAAAAFSLSGLVRPPGR